LLASDYLTTVSIWRSWACIPALLPATRQQMQPRPGRNTALGLLDSSYRQSLL